MKIYKNLFILLLIAGCLLTVSCNDKWDEHYTQSEQTDLSLMDYLRSNSDLSTFVEMLELTGYADSLELSRAYTVFAPVNEALKNLDKSDLELLKKLVGNHITNYTHTTSELGATGTQILMNNAKYAWFHPAAGGFAFGGEKISEPDIVTKNGVVHILENYYPYQPNIWEFIQIQANLDSLKNYLNSLTQLVFDTEASYDQSGIFMDSIFKTENWVLDQLGPVNDERYIFTAILPTNTAWNETYQTLFPYYRSLNKTDGTITTSGAILQVSRTKKAIVQDCFFLGAYNVPTGLDSLQSLYGNVFKNPDYLFAGATPYTMSNGLSYVTDKLKNKPEDSWFKEIRVEAESDPYSLRTNINCDLDVRTSLGTIVTASDNHYVRFTNLPASSLSKISAIFPIPNTLSGLRYNIYCVFIPTVAIDPSDLRPFYLNFYLTYFDETGKKKADLKLTPAVSVTDSTQVTKLLVAENFVFPYCDLIETANYKNEINVFLKVENAATTTDERNGKYSRSAGIDCIILEPVIE